MLAAGLAVAVATPLLLAGLGQAPFDDPGEGMHAAIGRELWQRGGALPLTLIGVPYLDKPPLLYALLAGAFAVAGPSETAARLVPALAALVAIAATAWLGARLLDARTGVVAGLALMTSLGFFVYGRYVRPESLFLAALAVGFALALSGIAEGRPARVAAGLAAFGLAALAKDPLGALGPPLTVALAMALARRLRPLGRWLPWPGALAGAALAFGWWALAEAATPGFAWYTVVDNHVLNVARARHFPDEDVPLSLLQFAVVAVLGAAPWVLAAGAMSWRLVRTRAWREPAETPWVALALWTLGVLALTALSPFRLPHYGLPAYPAIALLAARGWRELGARSLAVLHAALLGTLAIACLLAWTSEGSAFVSGVLGATDVASRKSAAAGVAAPLPPWSDLRPFVGTAGLALAGGAVALALAAVAGTRGLSVGVTLAALALLLPSAAGALALVSAQRAVQGIAGEIAQRAGPRDVLVLEGPIENAGALEWYGGRRPVVVDGRRSVLGFGATLPGASDTFWDETRLREAWTGAGRVWLVTARPPELSVASRLPGGEVVAHGGGRRLHVNR